MSTFCDSVIGGFVSPAEVVTEQFDFFTNLVTGYLNNANTFSQKLADYEISPVEIQPPVWDVNAAFIPFELPAAPADFDAPDPRFTDSAPHSPNISSIDTSALRNLSAPDTEAPAPLALTIPAPPVTVTPTAPGAGPTVGAVELPVYVGGPLPDVPTLHALNLPTAPDINIAALSIQRPSFIAPDALQDTYRPDLVDYQDFLWTTTNDRVGDTGVYDMHARLQAMLAGGTGLPLTIERALFDRAIGRDEISSRQAVAQAEGEWAAKGFSLPGTTLLARVQEIRQQNRIEQGRINRELSIQFHTQEIENLRFSVQQAIALEGVLLDAHTKILSVARELADGHWVVAKGIYDSAVALFGLQLEIYKADIAVYTERIKAELVKLEVYKAQLDGLQAIGQLNQQLVDIYKVKLDAFLTGVEVYKAQIQGAEIQVRAELNKVEVYKAQIEAYSALLGAERVKYEIYNTTVDAEQVKAQIYTAQVDAYGRRIEAYRSNVAAEVAKVEALSRVNEVQSKIYSDRVAAWKAGIDADTANLASFVEVYRANLTKYTALLSAEQYRLAGESRNFELELESERARVDTLLKQADQAIAQLQHVSNIGLSATEIASKVNAQLAASAMSAINVSAGITASNSVQASDTRSCSMQYTASANV